MSAADRNKILIAGGIAIVAIIAIVLFLRGRGAKQPAETGAGAFGTGTQGAGQFATATPGQATPSAPGGVAPATPGTALAAEGAAAPAETRYPGTPIVMGTGPQLPGRKDPFVTFNPPPVPVPPEVTANLPVVTLQTGGLRPPGVAEAAGPLGRRRVAGLLFNEGAWAILEQEGQAFIVKPGDVVGGNRITAIGPDSIFVTDSEGKRWRVSLRALAPGGEAAAASTSVPGMPETPPRAF
jgi:hypothetical protein